MTATHAPALCPVHGIPDCSPLLNGCSRLTAKAMAHKWDLFGDPDDWSCLVLALGGSDTSWTGRFLELCQKSDPAHIAKLRRADPGLVAGWQAWRDHADGKGAGVIAAHHAWLNTADR